MRDCVANADTNRPNKIMSSDMMSMYSKHSSQREAFCGAWKAQKSVSAGALTPTQLEEFTTLPQTL